MDSALKHNLVQLLCFRDGFIDEETEVHECYVIFPRPQSQPETDRSKTCRYTNFWTKKFSFTIQVFHSKLCSDIFE